MAAAVVKGITEKNVKQDQRMNKMEQTTHEMRNTINTKNQQQDSKTYQAEQARTGGPAAAVRSDEIPARSAAVASLGAAVTAALRPAGATAAVVLAAIAAAALAGARHSGNVYRSLALRASLSLCNA